MDWIQLGLGVSVVVTLLAVLGVALSMHDRSVKKLVGERFIYGVPWGSLISLVFVALVYLVVQSGFSDFRDPVAIPFRAWSYFYPLGIVASPFTHASDGHLVGNLVGAVAVAPIAEYAWGHYPREEGDRVWHRPWVRAVCCFPGAVLGVGLLTGIFGLGPVIGFSSVIFAFAGFALVRYPITTLVASVAGQSALFTVYRALETPVLVYVPGVGSPSAPGWATIAIQGHAIGFAIGLAIGVAIFSRRGHRPDPFRFWIALVLFAFSKSLWAIYWFGDGSYILLRAPGVVLVLVLSVLLTAAVAAPHSRPGNSLVTRAHRRIAGHGLLVVVLLVAVLAGPAVPANLFVVADQDLEGEATVTVEDYTVTYAEDVENELVSFVDLSLIGIDTSVEANGVIVSSEQRHVWMEAVTARELSAAGESEVVLGGPAWRETVTADRVGWRPIGNSTAYQVWLETADERTMAHTGGPSTADAEIAGATVAIDPTDEEFAIIVDDGDRASAAIPAEDESVTVGPLEIDREDDRLYAGVDDTRVPVASRTG